MKRVGIRTLYLLCACFQRLYLQGVVWKLCGFVPVSLGVVWELCGVVPVSQDVI